MKTTSTGAAEWPPGGAVSPKVTVSTQSTGTDFLALLNQSQARTAPAEGHKKEIEKDSRSSRDRDDRVRSERPQRRDTEHSRRREIDREPVSGREPALEAAPAEQPAVEVPAAETSQNQTADGSANGQGSTPQGEQPAAQQPQAQAATAETAVATPVQVATLPLVEGTGAVVDPAAVAATPVAGAVTGAAAAVVVDPAAVVAAAAATAGTPATGEAAATVVTAGDAAATAAAVPVAGTAAKALDAAAAATVTTQVTDASPTAPAVTAQATDAAPAVKADTQQTQAPAPDQQQAQATTVADRAPANGQQGQHQGETPKHQQPQQQQAAAAVAAAQADQGSSSQSTSASSQNGSANPVQPFGGPTAPAAAATRRGESRATPVHISNAAEAVENTIRIASQRGVTHAKLALKPAELGGVEIRLLQTAAGLTATVMADSPEAAKLLQQAGQDLRQQLEAQGVQLQNLDISYSGDEPKSAAQAFSQLARDGRRSTEGGDANGTGSAAESDPIESTLPSTLELPDGVLVDVLA